MLDSVHDGSGQAPMWAFLGPRWPSSAALTERPSEIGRAASAWRLWRD